VVLRDMNSTRKEIPRSGTAAGAAHEDRQLVLDQLVPEAGEDGRSTGEACPLLLATAGREPSPGATLWEHATAYCGAAVANGVAEAWVSNRSVRKDARDGVASEVSAARAADPGSELISSQSVQI
jgi:hypothetical protein